MILAQKTNNNVLSILYLEYVLTRHDDKDYINMHIMYII